MSRHLIIGKSAVKREKAVFGTSDDIDSEKGQVYTRSIRNSADLSKHTQIKNIYAFLLVVLFRQDKRIEVG